MSADNKENQKLDRAELGRPTTRHLLSVLRENGAAYGAGAEVQSSGPIHDLAASMAAGLASGFGAYIAGGRQVNVTFATGQFGCPR